MDLAPLSQERCYVWTNGGKLKEENYVRWYYHPLKGGAKSDAQALATVRNRHGASGDLDSTKYVVEVCAQATTRVENLTRGKEPIVIPESVGAKRALFNELAAHGSLVGDLCIAINDDSGITDDDKLF